MSVVETLFQFVSKQVSKYNLTYLSKSTTICFTTDYTCNNYSFKMWNTMKQETLASFENNA